MAITGWLVAQELRAPVEGLADNVRVAGKVREDFSIVWNRT
jgi:hypothetical protein